MKHNRDCPFNLVRQLSVLNEAGLTMKQTGHREVSPTLLLAPSVFVRHEAMMQSNGDQGSIQPRLNARPPRELSATN